MGYRAWMPPKLPLCLLPSSSSIFCLCPSSLGTRRDADPDASPASPWDAALDLGRGDCPKPGSAPQGEIGVPSPTSLPSLQEMNIQQLTNYRKSIMNLSDGGKLYRKELEIVLCNEPPM